MSLYSVSLALHQLVPLISFLLRPVCDQVVSVVSGGVAAVVSHAEKTGRLSPAACTEVQEGVALLHSCMVMHGR